MRHHRPGNKLIIRYFNMFFNFLIMKKKFEKLIIAVSVICAVGMFFSSCNDYVADVNAELKGQIADLNADMSADLADLQTALENAINECKDNCAAKHIELEKADQENSDSIVALLQDVAALEARIEVLEASQKKVDSTLIVLDSITAAHHNTIDYIFRTYATIAYVDAAISKRDSIQHECDSLQNVEIAKVLQKANAAQAKADRDSMEIEKLIKRIEAIEKADSCTCTTIDTKSIWDKIKGNSDKIDNIQNKLDDLNNSIEGALETIKTHSDQIKSLQDADDLIKKDIENLQTAVEEIQDALADLEKRMSIVENRLDKRISSVVVNGAYSPVVGYFNLPTGMRSNILAAYYNVISSPANELKFPTVRTSNYVDPTAAFTDAEAAFLGFAETSYGAKNDILVGTEGYAGTLYLTINPNDVDTTGIKLALKNSLGEESALVLGPLVKSEKKLNFGYTRAANNGFYEVAATLDPANIEKAQIRVEVEDLKNVLSDFKSIGNGVNLSNAIGTLYNAVNDIADAYAVEATYVDSLGEHQVYSDYALAAVAVKPLSYNSLADLNVESFPGLGRVSNLVNKVFDKIGTINVPNEGLTTIINKLNAIELVGVIKDSVHFDVVIGTDTCEVSLPTTDILGDMDSKLNEIDAWLNDVNDLLANFNSKIELVEDTINSTLPKIENKLNEYLDKLNNKLCGFINSINDRLQPTMLVSTTDGFSLLSSFKGAPSMVNAASFTLVPTSYTGEILAPAMKKYVAVTAAFDKDGNSVESVARAANSGDLNTVLDGQTRAISFNGQSGYTYEITYSAVDFSGYISNTKYYVQVK